MARKLHAFVALLVVSLLIGLAAQFPAIDPDQILQSMQSGMAGTLGSVAVVVGLGAMLGRMLEISGGALVLARELLRWFGPTRAPLALGVTGFIVCIPVFFDVGFVVLVPILHGLARKAGQPLMKFAIPLLAGMAVTHSFVPPTPGPMAVASILRADLGYVILFGLLAGLPAMLVAGPLFGRFIAVRVPGRLPIEPDTELSSIENPPTVPTVAALIVLPIVLILLNTATNAIVGDATLSAWVRILRDVVTLIGHPFIALLITTLLAFVVLGSRRGLSRAQVHDIASGALEPAGVIILVTGAGGVLKQVMIDTDVGRAIAEPLVRLGVPMLVLAFLVAMIIRIMQGSSTVAMLTAAGLLSPVIEPSDPSPELRALLVIAIASGATLVSHVNDSGFWLINRYLGLTVEDTLRTWTATTALVAVVGLASTLVLSVVVT